VVLRARDRAIRPERGTFALGAVALGLTGAVVGGELARVWRRGREDDEREFGPVEAVRATVEVAVAGYEGGTPAENALFSLLTSFSLTFGTVRLATHLIHHHGTYGPFRNVRVGGRHVHHFIPGIVLAFLAGGASVVTRDERLDAVLAVPFGAGVALTLDESALLLKLDDVYWTEDGIVSVQITLAALAMLSAVTLAMKLLRRGERVLEPADGR
jgi:hypothetical protein